MSREVEHITDIIQDETSYFNGWSVSKETERDSCELAAIRIERYVLGRIKRALMSNNNDKHQGHKMINIDLEVG